MSNLGNWKQRINQGMDSGFTQNVEPRSLSYDRTKKIKQKAFETNSQSSRGNLYLMQMSLHSWKEKKNLGYIKKKTKQPKKKTY